MSLKFNDVKLELIGKLIQRERLMKKHDFVCKQETFPIFKKTKEWSSQWSTEAGR